MHRALAGACLALLAAFPAAAAEAVEEQDLAAAARVLDGGDWNARMRTVHALEYRRLEALPLLTRAAEDDDWQVRLAAVHELGPLGPRAIPVLRAVLRRERCPVVRLMVLHALGSQLSGAMEERAVGALLDPGSEKVECLDRSAPSPAPSASTAAATTAAAEPAEIDDVVVTPDPTPKTAAVAAPAPAPEAPPPPPVPREVDELLGAPADRGAPQSFPPIPATPPAEEHAPDKGKAFQDAGGKFAHDAIPDLLEALKGADVRARARAADELGSRGADAGAAVPALVAALGDKSPRVRASAGLALGDIGAGDRRVKPLLEKALKDKSPDVRYAAALALSRIRAIEVSRPAER